MGKAMLHLKGSFHVSRTTHHILLSILATSLLILSPPPIPAAQFKFATQTFAVPDGFEVELVAGPPLVDRPVSASFDEQGRLYVTDSSGSNDKPDKQLEERPHRVVRLEDTHGDGKFDKSNVFADRMMFPEGCLWHDGSVFVSAPPSIWKLTDTNNDGVADVRVEWHQGKTLTGCANDLHGPYLGPDGWIYWCKGAFASQTYELPDGKTFTSRAAHIFRARPDHTGLEPVMTGGMDNPVGLAFTAEGERILCGTFFVQPQAGKRDGLIHAIYGGVYGKVNEVTDEHKKTGDLMPVMTHMGPAAPCAVIRYRSRIFGDEYENNLFVCCFNMHKVTRHILQPDGATFKTKDSDFLVSDNTDFHPTDVIEDADGSLLVVDTGGWYKICCPTSQLSKPDVLGAIYRIRKKGAAKVNDPRGLELAWDKLNPAELVKYLDDDRPAVRKRAIQTLGRMKTVAIPALVQTLKKSQSDDARQNAVWALTQMDDPKAREATYVAFSSGENPKLAPNDFVAQTAIYSIGLWRDQNAVDAPSPDSFFAVMGLSSALQSSNQSMRRAAVETLGRTRGTRMNKAFVVHQLLREGLEPPMNRVLEHSLAYALMEIGDPKSTADGLTNRYSQRVALIALDQMDNGGLAVDKVAPFLASADPGTRKTAAWVASHHPDWGDELARFFEGRLRSVELKGEDLEELKQLLARFSSAHAIQNLMGSLLAAENTDNSMRVLMLQAIASAAPPEAPTSWVTAVRTCLMSEEMPLVRAATGAARALSQAKTNDFSEALRRIARNDANPADVRLDALAALPYGLRTVEPGQLNLIRENLDPSKPVVIRSAAANVLSRAKLTDSQLISLTDTVRIVGPLEMPKVMVAFERSTNEAVGMQLLAALKESKSRSSLRPDLLKPLLAKYPASVQQEGKELLASLNVDAGKQAAHLEELLPTLKDGDIRRGQALFNSPKAACSSCHTMGYMGGKVGPDLTTIGTVRTERDLLESIVYPSASFVRSYEPFVVKKKDDEEVSGILRKDAPDEVVLVTGPETEMHIPRAEVNGMRPGTVSIMPAGLEEQLTKQELADLIAFLKATKWGPR
jgi:putative membrane-bound dehydrogenase-like protein